MLHKGAFVSKIQEIVRKTLREGRDKVRWAEEDGQSNTEGGGDKFGRLEKDVDERVWGINKVEASIFLVSWMVFEKEIYVLPAEWGENEPQGALYRVQEQVYALLVDPYQRGRGRIICFEINWKVQWKNHQASRGEMIFIKT